MLRHGISQIWRLLFVHKCVYFLRKRKASIVSDTWTIFLALINGPIHELSWRVRTSTFDTRDRMLATCAIALEWLVLAEVCCNWTFLIRHLGLLNWNRLELKLAFDSELELSSALFQQDIRWNARQRKSSRYDNLGFLGLRCFSQLLHLHVLQLLQGASKWTHSARVAEWKLYARVFLDLKHFLATPYCRNFLVQYGIKLLALRLYVEAMRFIYQGLLGCLVLLDGSRCNLIHTWAF